MTVLPPARVLLVDDIAENLVALEALVRRLGVEVSCAQSASEALELLLEQEFALALIDVNMPEMDGFQLAELMRGAQRSRNVPIIFVTAEYAPQHRVFQGYDAGAVDFLFKPVDPRILRHKVATFLELYDHKRQLAESLRLHETFVAMLNHDLRAPLNTLTIGLTLLDHELQSDRQKQLLGRLDAACRRMSSMLDQLYDLARTRAGAGLPLEVAPGNLREVVEGVIGETLLRRSDRPVHLATTGDATGVWDLGRLSRLVSNLVSNALDHGDSAAPVTVQLDGCAPDHVTLAVCNQGVIPADMLPQLFEPFRRGPTSAQGLGLGLYIVREVATAHGGEISVSSEPETGTRFEVQLPRHTSAPPQA